jgi:hypothetical protein
MIAAYCRKRLASNFTPVETEALRRHFTRLATSAQHLYRSDGSYDWNMIAVGAGVPLPRFLLP